jgi:Ca2+-binding RTX toxin-like protein
VSSRSLMRLRPLLILGSAAASLAVVSPSMAAEVARPQPNRVVYRAAAGEINAMTVQYVFGSVVITDTGATRVLSTGPGCVSTGLAAVCSSKPGKVTEVQVYTFDGNDSVTVVAGSAAHTFLFGGSGDDTLTGGQGGTSIYGEAGDDTLTGGKTFDTIVGDAGNDKIVGASGYDRLEGGPGDDIISGDAGGDSILGGDGNDKLAAGDGDDTLAGGDGSDTVTGGAGQDVIDGDSGNDNLSGGASHDAIHGGDGNDELHAGDDFDYLWGGPGDDRLYGEAGRDYMVGEAGDDTLDGGADFNEMIADTDTGADVYHGAGTDFVYYRDRTPDLTITADDLADDGELGEHDNVGSDIEGIYGGRGNDRITSSATGSTRAFLNGYAGDDVLMLRKPGGADGFPGNDTLTGSSGDDILSGSANDDVIDGGAGRDVIRGDDWGTPFGNDLLLARDGEPDEVACDGGNDTAQIDTGAETSVTNCEIFLP